MSAVKEATNVTAGLGTTSAKFHRCTVDPRTDSERSTPVMYVSQPNRQVSRCIRYPAPYKRGIVLLAAR